MLRRACFLKSGNASRFLDLSQIQLKAAERPEDLYQRLVSFFDDNLQTVEDGLSHHGVAPLYD